MSFLSPQQKVYMNINRILSVASRLMETGHYAAQHIGNVAAKLDQVGGRDSGRVEGRDGRVGRRVYGRVEGKKSVWKSGWKGGKVDRRVHGRVEE